MSADEFNPAEYLSGSNKFDHLTIPSTDAKGRQIGIVKKESRPPRVIDNKQANEILRKGVAMEVDEIKQAEIEEAQEAKKQNTIGKVIDNTDVKYVQVGPVTVPVPSTTYACGPYDNYFNQRNRVTFELAGGSYSLPAIDMVESSFGVMVILPAGDSDVTFIPSPGAELTIIYDDKRIACFSPGTVFNVNELKVIIISLVKRDIENE